MPVIMTIQNMEILYEVAAAKTSGKVFLAKTTSSTKQNRFQHMKMYWELGEKRFSYNQLFKNQIKLCWAHDKLEK